MTKGLHRKKKAAARKGSDALTVDFKVNILHTIADAIYSTPAGKIREAVANSRDNGATWVIITLDQTNRRMSILDNGNGITEQRFHDIFESIGYGGLADQQGPTLSYFGLGLMSIFRLGNHVKVYTHPRDNGSVLLVEIEANAIFQEASKQKSISHLSQFVKSPRDVKESDRQEASLELLNEALSLGNPVSFPPTFTEILIEDIDQDRIDEMGSADFREELTQLLPLRARDDESFLKRFTGTKGLVITELLRNPEYCKNVDVYLGIQELTAGEQEGAQEQDDVRPIELIPQLWKYFPKFNSSITFPDDNVYVGAIADSNFAYYAIHTIGEDLQRDARPEERETGFWFRNQNFLVKSADFLDRPGPGRKPSGTIDRPLRIWVFGEVFHKDMNDFIRVGRNEFLYDMPAFTKFRRVFLENVTSPVNRAIRKVWEKRKPVIDNFITPFAKIAENDGPIKRAEGRLRLMIGRDHQDREFFRTAKALLAKRRSRQIEDDSASVDAILSDRGGPLVLADDDNARVRIAPSLSKSAGMYDIRWDHSAERVLVDVSPSLFRPRDVVFLGETFRIVFVAKRDNEAGVSINVDDRRIYVNPFNHDLIRFSVSVLDVYIALEVADAVSKTKGELKRNFLRLLGAAASEAGRYVGPLGDDLRRSVAYMG